jgi:Tfp pilus assembly protein PilX
VPRPILILLILLVVIVLALFALASFDSAVPVTRVEQPVTNAAPR